MRYRILTAIAAAALFLTGTGCATKDGTEADFGKSVRQMTEQQIFDMNAATSPDPNAVLGGDPDRLNNTLNGHREDVANPAGVAAPVTINVGGSSQ